jgi:DNA-directed RNA polymerase specialized sigma24 family protein
MVKANNIEENDKRLKVLYTESHKWLLSAAYNITKDKDEGSELVAELYLYLTEKVNPEIWYSESFNLKYLHTFLKTRYLNKIKYNSRYAVFCEEIYDNEEDIYDEEYDSKLESAYNSVVDELKLLERSPKMWAPARITELYLFDSEMTLEKLAANIKISKSTAFLNVKKIKKYLKDKIENPFKHKTDV